MGQIIEPSYSTTWTKKPTPGEIKLLNFMKQQLSNDYLIFPEYRLTVPAPFAHARDQHMYADFVVLNTRFHDAWIIEVKDWNPDTVVNYRQNGVTLLLDDGPKAVKNPHTQAHEYSLALRDELSKSEGEIFKRVTATVNLGIRVGWGVVFTNIDRDEFQKWHRSVRSADMDKALFGAEVLSRDTRDFLGFLNNLIEHEPLIPLKTPSISSPIRIGPVLDPPKPPHRRQPHGPLRIVVASLSIAFSALALMLHYRPREQGKGTTDNQQMVAMRALDVRDHPWSKALSEARVPKGTHLHVIGGGQNDWKEVEVEISSTSRAPRRIHGFVDGKYLVPAPSSTPR